MDPTAFFQDRRRVGSLGAAVLLHVGLIFVFLGAFQVTAGPVLMRDSLKTIAINPVQKMPPSNDAVEEKAARKEGAASAANLRKKPAPVEAPKSKAPAKRKTPAAPNAGEGREDDAGSADQPGAGQGGGGEGSGTGSGRGGDGDGGGGNGRGNGGGIAVEPRLISGAIRNKDYPKAAAKIRAQGKVVVIYTVGTDGRVSGCSTVKSSRNADLDSITCKLITQRFRYAPARNRDGQAVAAKTMWQQSWWLEGKRGRITNPDEEVADTPDVIIREIPKEGQQP